MANPVTDSSLGTGEKVVKDSDFMAQEHQAVNEVGAYEASATSDKDALALGRRHKPDRREARKGGV